MIFTPQTIIKTYHALGKTRLMALGKPPIDIILGFQELWGDREVAIRLLAFDMMKDPEYKPPEFTKEL